MTAGKEKKKREKLSLVVPAYNEEEALPIFYREARKVEEQLPQVEIEYLFVDDGSVDGTMDVIRRLHEEDPRVHYVSFSRNFGKEAAIYAGLENAAGDYVAILDADLQDPPALLPEMLRIVTEEGYDCIQKRGASDTLLVCPHVLQDHEPDLQRGCGGRRQGLSVDEPKSGLGDSVHEGVQPLFQGNLRLGRI